MRIPYGKRRYVPACCPRCNSGPGWYSTGWQVYLGEHPSFPGLPWWWGYCGCDQPSWSDMLKEEYADNVLDLAPNALIAAVTK